MTGKKKQLQIINRNYLYINVGIVFFFYRILFQFLIGSMMAMALMNIINQTIVMMAMSVEIFL